MTELSPWQQWKQNLGETRPWDFVNPNTLYSSDTEASRRLEICKSCPEFIKASSQCKLCGCLMVLKTKLEKAACPIGKW
jgi:hypothetical protein